MSTPTAVSPATEARRPRGLPRHLERDRRPAPPGRHRPRLGAAGRYRDPLMASDGHAGIDAMLAAVQARFPGFVIKRTSAIDAIMRARFAWSLGPAAGPAVVEGVDFCALSPDGRLVSVVGFIDRMPAAA